MTHNVGGAAAGEGARVSGRCGDRAGGHLREQAGGLLPRQHQREGGGRRLLLCREGPLERSGGAGVGAQADLLRCFHISQYLNREVIVQMQKQEFI